MTGTDLILGTAGHIDHGKTSLIKALTGTDTDRLPEEKRRGITIELGFAELQIGEFRFGIVDVPGHERFIRNMLCGATGMDLVMLVVAADDSIKQQTREHLDILRLLDLQGGVIVLTKVDLVDPEWLELVENEVREFVAGTFLERAAVIRTSAATGAGLEELRRELQRLASGIAPASGAAAAGSETGHEQLPFRMAIDRGFTIAGHGTVVTGSVSSGICRVGDELELQPGGISVRVRGIRNHHRVVESIHRGQRAAINLAGVHHDEIARGQQLASIGHLLPSKLLTASVSILGSAPRPLVDRARLKFHLGTAEVGAVVRLLGRPAVAPGETGSAQFFLAEPVAAVWNQPFVIRAESPAVTLGGGRILVPRSERIRRVDEEVLTMVERLRASAPAERGAAAAYFFGFADWQPADLARAAGVSQPAAVASQLLASGELREIAVSPTRKRWLHQRVLAKLHGRVEAALARLHSQFPLRTQFDWGTLVSGFAYLQDEAILQAVCRDLARAGRIKFTDRGLSLAGHGPRLSANEQKLFEQLVALIRDGGTQPPSVKECQQQAAKHQAAVPQLLALAAANGELVEISADLFFHSSVERDCRERLRESFASLPQPASGGLTVSEIREILKTSRKYAVPYCEYLDRIGFTLRRGDVRTLNRV